MVFKNAKYTLQNAGIYQQPALIYAILSIDI